MKAPILELPLIMKNSAAILAIYMHKIMKYLRNYLNILQLDRCTPFQSRASALNWTTAGISLNN